jgi:hypothetical protein
MLRARIMGTISGYSPGCAKLAETTPVRATMDPTERSIPSLMMTNIMPMARMPFIEACLMILIKLAGLAKAFGERIMRIRRIAAKTKTIPNSRIECSDIKFLIFFILISFVEL